MSIISKCDTIMAEGGVEWQFQSFMLAGRKRMAKER